MQEADLLEAIKAIASNGWAKLPESSGVYAIVNSQTHKAYIGASSNLRMRIWGHKSRINSSAHPNRILNSDAQVYGVDSFSCGVLVECPEEEMYDIEYKFIKALPKERRYNIDSGERFKGNVRGCPIDEDRAASQRRRSAEFRKRKKATPEVRGIYAPVELHDYIKSYLLEEFRHEGISIAGKRATKEKA